MGWGYAVLGRSSSRTTTTTSGRIFVLFILRSIINQQKGCTLATGRKSHPSTTNTKVRGRFPTTIRKGKTVPVGFMRDSHTFRAVNVSNGESMYWFLQDAKISPSSIPTDVVRLCAMEHRVTVFLFFCFHALPTPKLHWRRRRLQTARRMP